MIIQYLYLLCRLLTDCTRYFVNFLLSKRSVLKGISVQTLPPVSILWFQLAGIFFSYLKHLSSSCWVNMEKFKAYCSLFFFVLTTHLSIISLSSIHFSRSFVRSLINKRLVEESFEPAVWFFFPPQTKATEKKHKKWQPVWIDNR